MSEAEEAQIRFLFRAGRVCGQPRCSERSLNKYFTYAQLKSYRLGRERRGGAVREMLRSSESSKKGNLMLLLDRFFPHLEHGPFYILIWSMDADTECFYS